MATRYLTRSLLSTTAAKPPTSVISHPYTTAAAVIPKSPFILRLRRPLSAAASASPFRRIAPLAMPARGFSTRQRSSSLNDRNSNWSNQPPKETILLDGCDFEHWLVVVEPPAADMTRDDIIDSYIKTLAAVVGSEEEARMKIYSVSTRHYFAFGALVSEELSVKLKELQNVRWVLPDSYLDVRNKDYGGEPFINGQAVPYDPKYHEEWLRNHNKSQNKNVRNRRTHNDGRNFDRKDTRINYQDSLVGPGNTVGPQDVSARSPPSQGGMPSQNSSGNYPLRGPPPANNAANYQYRPTGGPAPYQSGPGPIPTGGLAQGQNHAYAPNMGGGNPYQGQNVHPNREFGPNGGYGPGPNQNQNAPPQFLNREFGPNGGYGPGLNQTQNAAPQYINREFGPNGGYGPGPNQSQNAPPQPPNRKFGPGQNSGGVGPNGGYGSGQNQSQIVPPQPPNRGFGANAGYGPGPDQNNYNQNQNVPNQGGYGNHPPQNVPGRDQNY